MPQRPFDRKLLYHARDRAGVCCNCGKPRQVPGRKLCDRCSVTSRRAGDKWKAKQDRYEQRKKLLWKYGLTLAQWDAMLAGQGGRCALCGTDRPVTGGWQVDHCHGSGRVRGLLCRLCNVGLGSFKDDPALLERAAAYVRKHKVTLVG